MELFNTKEAAARLRISPSALHKLRMDGKIPYVQIGRKVFFKEEHLVDFINNNQRIIVTKREVI